MRHHPPVPFHSGVADVNAAGRQGVTIMKISKLVVITAGLVAAAALADAPAGDGTRGAAVFKAQCAACHLQKAGDTSPPIGPQLLGVVGRKAGSWDHFKYTDAMKKSGVIWSAKLLDQYLENPYSLVPGAAMGLLVPAANNRADVIAYLSSSPEELRQKDRVP
jgi:cytochrome c